MADLAQEPDAVRDALLGDTSGSDVEEPRRSSAELCGVDENQRLQTAKKPTKNLGNCNDRAQLKTWYEHEKTAKKPQFATEDKCESYLNDTIEPEIKNAENGYLNLRVKDSTTGEMKTVKENVSLNLQKKYDDLEECESRIVQVGYRKSLLEDGTRGFVELTLNEVPHAIMVSISKAQQKIKQEFGISGHESRALAMEKSLCTEIQLLSAFTKALEQKYTKLFLCFHGGPHVPFWEKAKIKTRTIKMTKSESRMQLPEVLEDIVREFARPCHDPKSHRTHKEIVKKITWLYEDIVKTNFHEKKGFYRLMVTRMKNDQWMTIYLS